jgi:hypothetical protein
VYTATLRHFVVLLRLARKITVIVFQLGHECFLPNPFQFIVHEFTLFIVGNADHSARAVYVMNSLRPLDHWVVGPSPTRGMDVLCAFILCLCCSVCR